MKTDTKIHLYIILIAIFLFRITWMYVTHAATQYGICGYQPGYFYSTTGKCEYFSEIQILGLTKQQNTWYTNAYRHYGGHNLSTNSIGR